MKIINYASVIILFSTAIHAEVKLTIHHYSGLRTTYVLSDKTGKEIDRKETPGRGRTEPLTVTLVAQSPGNYDLTMANTESTRTKEIAIDDTKEIKANFDINRIKFQIKENGPVTEL